MKATLKLLSITLLFGSPAIAQDDWGSISLNTRARYETAEQTGRDDADNTSLRARLGYTTPAKNGFKAMVEGEFTFVADEDSYNAAGVSGDSSKAVIADPESQQLDQLWAAYSGEANGTKFNAKVGRQVIALDGQRWIGHVGWRQNRQTYDAVTLGTTLAGGLDLKAGYIDNVVRIFGSDAPDSGGNASEFDSESIFLNAKYKAGDAGTFTAYGYFLDLDNAPGRIKGNDTIGLSYDGSFPLGEGKAGVHLEYANQTDGGDSPLDYSATYMHGALKGGFKGLSLELGYELLGSDETGVDDEGNPTYASVVAPLATLHKFNGFADVFLLTPTKGLEDAYVMAGYKFDLGKEFGPLIAKAWYHDFSTDEGGDDLGSEVDVVLAKPLPIKGLPGTLGALFKYADYDAPEGGNDLTRTIFELNYSQTF